jgi:hypoxanthine phosphoribosyltransferase
MSSVQELLQGVRAETLIPEAVIALLCFFLGEFSARWRDRRRERIERERANRQNRYTWDDFVEGADKVGKRLVSQFKPDVVISFAGPGAVFANLVLAKTLNRKSLSAMKLYMGRFLDKSASPDAAVSEEYDIVTGERLHVLLPKSLQQGDRSWKILILDETVTTGSSMRSIKKYLNDLGYRNIRAGCLVCCEGAKLVDPHTVDFAAYSNVGNTFVLPWGKSPL